ncbi:MAG: 3-beta hydroxysteroid dehydrogenase [Deltaproteobacteria bacterium]|nr:3-beta hydroxysteroid dehydrogenase [Deltaproteobacteria bacterium]
MRVLITGGAGFLGFALARRLCDRGHSVRSFSRGDHPSLAAHGIEAVRGDLADSDAVARAVAGRDIVFHVASRVGGWGPVAEFVRTNVEGTQHVIDACRRHGVSRLVYTSTPSVVHDAHDLEGADESLPYAKDFEAAYPATKAQAEARVLAANDATLATVALRPHLVWGPGDNQLLPRLLERARSGRLRHVGDGRNRVDATYIDNAVDAHLLAGERLAPGAPCAGRAYFIANDEPRPARELLDGVLAAAGLPAPRGQVPARVAWLAGAGFELVWTLLRRVDEPPLTRFAARQLATAHWFDLSAAKRDLGYRPRVGTDEGLERLRRHLAEESLPA